MARNLQDDVVMAVIDIATDVMEANLTKAVAQFKDIYHLLALARGSAACAVERILEMDGFNAVMIVDLFTKRFHNYVQLFPARGAASELHNSDFMDMIYGGWRYLDRARRKTCGAGTCRFQWWRATMWI